MYITYEKENSIVTSYNAVVEKLMKLDYIRNNYPSQFNESLKVKRISYENAKEVLSEWLLEVVDSKFTYKKKNDVMRQVTTLIEILDQPGERITDNQGLAINNFIYSEIAKILGRNFFEPRGGTSHPTFQRSYQSTFDSVAMSNFFKSVKTYLESIVFTNYLEIEHYVNKCIDSILAMKEIRYSA